MHPQPSRAPSLTRRHLLQIGGIGMLGLGLPELLQGARERQSKVVEVRLWDSGYLFLFVAACLSAEWALRKRFGLA